ncbi:hypothetical protein B0H12DRAFT_549876 [Mycena haematopus]|nr:hypothetical protein B0H12DRAFT_549876 [Mycena haematopus]
MSYSGNPWHGWNASEPTRIDRNLPSISSFSPQDNSPAIRNIQEINMPSSLSPRHSRTPDSQSANVFSTGSLIEALSAPPSSPGNSAARPIRRRKATHKRQSSTGSRHPSSPSSNAEAARAEAAAMRSAALAAMRQALSVQQGPRIPSPDMPTVSARLPLGPARQPQIGPLVEVHVEQRPFIPQEGTGAIRRGRRVGNTYSNVQVQGRRLALYQTAQQTPRRYAASARSIRPTNSGPYPIPF